MKVSKLIKKKQEIIKIAKFLYNNKYVVASDGNLSIRLDSQKILITRSNVCKGEIGLKDIIALPLNLTNNHINKLKVQPSSEYQMHKGIYYTRADVNFIIHAHPLYATLIGASNIQLNFELVGEIEKYLGTIGYIEYFEPGSIQLANAVSEKATKCDIIILKRHGVVITGKNSIEARYRLERLERLAQISFLFNLSRH
ncbi:MAG: class II aldolase/adducin family protein [candidate division WOR-3 bacterium]|nr:class II aldolase/adducin family protein [candidate division WOR-3 bacterium]MCX7757361.1 class II aldolase/adducin family protein [candidate division WOR-3 bacterium]MDW7987487.1 class II aldolase/adducin family protein [candidate division WOR-3 bacterium]